MRWRRCRSITASARSTARGGQSAGGPRARGVPRRSSRALCRRAQRAGTRCASGLSPYLHFGHISAHEVFRRADDARAVDDEAHQAEGGGAREGWWGASAAAEAFLDELVTWRELGFNMCHLRDDYDRYESLPAWAQATLEEHARDPRPHRYTLGAVRSRRDARSAVERRAASARARRPHAQLPAHAVGQEDPRVVGDAARGARRR